jgi:hypothetical protein
VDYQVVASGFAVQAGPKHLSVVFPRILQPSS